MESFVTRLSWEEPRNAGTGPRADPGMRGQILGRILGWIPTRGDGSWNVWVVRILERLGHISERLGRISERLERILGRILGRNINRATRRLPS